MGQSSQFLTFTIADEHFGMDLHQTREIIEYAGITEVPLMPKFISGVINLRGEVVPVIDLSVRLGRQPITIHKRTCVIVIELFTSDQNCTLGLLADAVNEVIDIPLNNIEDAPTFGAKIRAEFIQGIAKKGDDFIVLLDAEKTLSLRELASLIEAEMQ
jgi:purine-binding chemotaxis protein CheW